MIKALHLWGFFIYRQSILSLHIRIAEFKMVCSIKKCPKILRTIFLEYVYFKLEKSRDIVMNRGTDADQVSNRPNRIL